MINETSEIEYKNYYDLNKNNTYSTCESKMPNLRHELKFRLKKKEDIELPLKLKLYFDYDVHTNFEGKYTVCSLYFDSPNDSALIETLSKISEREKYRIRYYNNDKQNIKLEKKCKQHGLGYKLSTSITKQEVERILVKDYEFLKVSDDELLRSFYLKLVNDNFLPKTIVMYEREAFVYNLCNTRITFDRSIKTSFNVENFLNVKQEDFSLQTSVTLLEVKFDEYMPSLVNEVLNIKKRNKSGFSKYAISRTFD